MRLVFAVLPGIAVKGQHGGNARGAGPPHRVHHDEQFHQVMVGGRGTGLDDKNVLAPDIFLDFDERFAVGKRLDGALAQLNADISGNVGCQRRIGVAGKKLHKLFVNCRK
jgi:hypothetical protein